MGKPIKKSPIKFLSKREKLAIIRKELKGRGLKMPTASSKIYKTHFHPMLHDDVQGGAFLGTLSKVLGYVSMGSSILAPIASFIPPLAPAAPVLGAIGTLTGVGSKISAIADEATREGSGLKTKKSKANCKWQWSCLVGFG